MPVKIRLLKRVNPAYPDEARKQGITGKVTSKITISKEGKVTRVEVIESPHELLSDSAAAALPQWEYEPPTMDGNPVSVIATVHINFQLR